MPESKEKFNFTDAYEELEKINEWFQEKDIDLDEGLKKYKKGLELIKNCRKRLKEAENQFHDIKKEFKVEETKKTPIKNDINSDDESETNSEKIPF